MRPIVFSILMLTSGLAFAQDVQPHPPARIEPVPEAPPSLEAILAEPHLRTPACLETSVHRLKHISAAEAAKKIDAALREKHGIETRVQGLVVESQLILIPEPVSNSLIVAALPEFVPGVRELIEKADRPPRQFVIEARITRLDADGGRVLISRPRLRTTAGTPTMVRSQDGEGRGYELEIIVEDVRLEQDSPPGAPDKTAAATSVGEAVPPGAAEVIVKPKRHSADLTEEEIEQKLREKTSLHFESVPLNNAMRQVARQAGINVVLDDIGLMERGVRPGRTVSVEASNLPLGEIVRQLLAPLGLDFRIEDEVLKITSRMRSRGPLMTRTYPVADVATETGKGIPKINLRPLVEKIEAEVHPDSWVHNGGPAVIRPFGNTLIIRQSEEGHELIENLLTSIRHEMAQEPTKLDVRAARALLPPMLVPAQIEPVSATQPARAEPARLEPEQSKPVVETRTYAIADLTRLADGSHEIAWLLDELRPLCSAEEGICASVRADRTKSNLVVHGSAAIHAEVERRLEQIRRIKRHFVPESARQN